MQKKIIIKVKLINIICEQTFIFKKPFLFFRTSYIYLYYYYYYYYITLYLVRYVIYFMVANIPP